MQPLICDEFLHLSDDGKLKVLCEGKILFSQWLPKPIIEGEIPPTKICYRKRTSPIEVGCLKLANYISYHVWIITINMINFPSFQFKRASPPSGALEICISIRKQHSGYWGTNWTPRGSPLNRGPVVQEPEPGNNAEVGNGAGPVNDPEFVPENEPINGELAANE